jgi:hypothetical protein
MAMTSIKEEIERVLIKDPDMKSHVTREYIDRLVDKTCYPCHHFEDCGYTYPQWEKCEKFDIILEE